MIKLIATDMDGTFCDQNKKWSPDFKDVFYQLKERGILFCAASGRQYMSLYNDFYPMSKDMLFIAENGGYVAYGEKCLKAYSFDKELFFNVIYKLDQIKNLMLIPCGTKSAYTLKKNQCYEHEIKKYYAAYEFIDSYTDIDDEIVKIAIYDPEYNITQYLDQIHSNMNDELKLVTSGFEWMDITKNDVNKGHGISIFLEKFNLKKEECAAFGDNMNDFELLSSVKYSYAMENAVQPIKDIAYEVIGHHNDFAVVQKIKEILNEK